MLPGEKRIYGEVRKSFLYFFKKYKDSFEINLCFFINYL